jgi:uncharacterized protein
MKRWPFMMVLLFVLSGVITAQREDFISLYGVQALSERTYDGGTISAVRTLEGNSSFTKTLVRWDSDGLTQYGFLNVPNGKGPYPVVFVLHGYVNPYNYRIQTYTTRYADRLARNGYVVLHPNYRGHAPSQGSPDGTFRVGYAADVLHALASIRTQSGKSGLFAKADGTRVGLWGHSMGGGISIRVMTVKPDWVDAVVLYGSMSGDELKNAQQVYNVFSNRTRGLTELRTSQKILNQISPIKFAARVQAAVSVHHGTRDEQVPYAWSLELCRTLKNLGKRNECFGYANAPHLFGRGSRTDELFQSRVIAFFKRELK